MLIHAYDEMYVAEVMDNLAFMLDYAVYDLKFEADVFFDYFIYSGFAHQIEIGNPKYTVGMSGIELAREVIYKVYKRYDHTDARFFIEKSPEYWVAWSLAYYNWKKNISFKNIVDIVPIKDILKLYPVLHEADIEKFVDVMDAKIKHHIKNSPTNLAILRKGKNLSQAELAEKSGVSLRMIQLYEQKQNDINKAQISTVSNLSKALKCTMEEIINIDI